MKLNMPKFWNTKYSFITILLIPVTLIIILIIFLKKKFTRRIHFNIPIICVGESVEDRDDGRAIDVIKKQLDESIPKNINKNNIMIAYEPIWAIGTGRVPNNSSINEMLNMIKDWLVKNERDSSINILYGGSVNKSNAEEIFLCSNIGGLLIGGVSLKADEFSEICLMVN